MGLRGSSNVRCQGICRDKGFILAAAKGNQCHCGNIYPQGNQAFIFQYPNAIALHLSSPIAYAFLV